MMHASHFEDGARTKKPYHSPQIQFHGRMAEITRLTVPTRDPEDNPYVALGDVSPG